MGKGWRCGRVSGDEAGQRRDKIGKTATGRAARKRLGLGDRLRWQDFRDKRYHLADRGDGDGGAFAEKAIVADFHEAGRELMLQEAADKFEGIQSSGSQPAAVGIAAVQDMVSHLDQWLLNH
jgi:hypothetical protein